MSQWMVEYWSRTGRAAATVNALSEAAAARALRLPADRIIRVHRRRGEFNVRHALASKPPHQAQLLFLARAMAMYSSAWRVDVNRLITEFGVLRRIAEKEPQAMREDFELSRRLKHLRFDSIVVALVLAGERTGRMELTLRIALEYVKQHERVRNATSAQFSLALLLFGASCAAFFAVPIALSEPLQNLIGARGVQIELTPATHFMLWINQVFRELWAQTSSAIAGLGFLVWTLRERLAGVWPLNLIGRLRRIRRATRLLMVWVPYRVTGLALERETTLLRRVLGTAAARVALPRLAEGASLSDVLTRRWFGSTLTQVGHGLDSMAIDDFKRVSGVVMDALMEEHKAMTKQLAALLYIGGMLATIGVVAMVAFGLIFPILGATTNV